MAVTQIYTHIVTNVTGSGSGYVSPLDPSTPQSVGANNNAQALVTTPGTFKNLRVRLTNPAGLGKSRTFTLEVDETATALTATLADNDVEAVVPDGVAVAVGQRVRFLEAATGSPDVPGEGATWTLEFEADDGRTVMFGSSCSTSGIS